MLLCSSGCFSLRGFRDQNSEIRIIGLHTQRLASLELVRALFGDYDHTPPAVADTMVLRPLLGLRGGGGGGNSGGLSVTGGYGIDHSEGCDSSNSGDLGLVLFDKGLDFVLGGELELRHEVPFWEVSMSHIKAC